MIIFSSFPFPYFIFSAPKLGITFRRLPQNWMTAFVLGCFSFEFFLFFLLCDFSVSLLNGVPNTWNSGGTKGCGMTVSASEKSFNVEKKRFVARLDVLISYAFLRLGWVAINLLRSLNVSETSWFSLTIKLCIQVFKEWPLEPCVALLLLLLYLQGLLNLSLKIQFCHNYLVHLVYCKLYVAVW